MEMSKEWYQGFVETGFGEGGGPKRGRPYIVDRE